MSDTLQVTAEKRPKGQINVVSEPSVPSAVQPGQTVTITRGQYESWRAFTQTPLVVRLNGVDVTADMVGNDYTVPSDVPNNSTLVIEESPVVTGGFTITRQLSRSISVPPTITQGASFPFVPQFGAPLTIDPATATGSPDPTITYDMQRGGTTIGAVNDLEFNGITEADIGAQLGVLVTASNGISPDATDTQLTAPVVYSEGETWEDYAIGDSGAALTGWNVNSTVSIVSNAASPTGRSASIKPDSNNPEETKKAIWSSAVANAASVDYVESFFVVKWNDTASRAGFMMHGNNSLGAVGLFMRESGLKHHIEGIEDSFSAPGLPFGPGSTLAVRHRIEGTISTLWVWDINDPEPADSNPTSARDMGTTMPLATFAYFGRLEGTDTNNELHYVSFGIDTPPPRDSRFQLIPPESGDVMEYSAPAEQGATSVTGIDGDTMTITVEDTP